ncbi:hypothetical protein BAE44_0005884 [Dichanthelium oligosanthes]|uniref:Bifunctional inhibitor/plant lipid transfer protein/seed storage helical domain-containing protein n=1 Tax=Dichanthelium oligosanthes TaxID=888268 RepID=A0A1E5W6X7_9POAL|nr:hypothetical protein BAE44_0005884 [Dichanthelium oligosanthes]
MAAAGWSLVVSVATAAAAAAVVVVALSSSWCAATAAARPLPYAGSSSSPTSLDCATVTSLLAGCKAFVRRGEASSSSSPSVPAPGAACCEGVAELYAVAADSADNWRSVCGCMAGLVRRYSSNASAIALLPVLCAVLPPAGRAVGDNLTYCTRYEDEPPEPEIEEGAEEELENNNEDVPDDVAGAEGEDKEQEKKARERKTSKYMTKYERARILGTRALQISMNAPVMVELEGETDPLEVKLCSLAIGIGPLEQLIFYSSCC